MPEPQHSPGGDDNGESPAAQPVPVPDEDGPHDVPDDKVIEKTLPAAPVPDLGGPRSSPARDKSQD